MYSRNEQAFDLLTEEALYWLGFLTADGSVTAPTDKRGGVLVFALKDKEPVEQLRVFLGSNAPIKHESNVRAFSGDFTIHRLTICSTPLVRRLIELGVTPTKTYTAEAIPEAAMNPSFWRGMIDGDGSVSINKRGQLVIYFGCASERLVRQFRDFVKRYVATKAEVSQHNVNKHWRFQLTGAPAHQLFNLLTGTPTLKFRL